MILLHGDVPGLLPYLPLVVLGLAIIALVVYVVFPFLRNKKINDQKDNISKSQ